MRTSFQPLAVSDQLTTIEPMAAWHPATFFEILVNLKLIL
jgi:hypothetical protein